MELTEKIKVYLRHKNGRTVCICMRKNKKCKKDCIPDVVERDKFYGWEKMFRQNRYGK